MIRQAAANDFDEWLRMRKLLYPEYSQEELLSEIKKIFHEKTIVGESDYAVFVYEKGKETLGGFIETSIRQNVSKCKSSPVGYIESLYVDSDIRRKGIARALVSESEKWIIERKCSEFAVDTDPGEKGSIDFYLSCSFAEIERSKDEILMVKEVKIFT
ncbi:MAG: GNAT family N-acetyltransferase [Sedimentisphaerales bacterium]|nr:GNAT family N-acetyltransferase [Sedimentisphaerales bacterium]